ncbi:hypothetical protein BDW69DRAFT_174813 [Aspergillus filifer]
MRRFFESKFKSSGGHAEDKAKDAQPHVKSAIEKLPVEILLQVANRILDPDLIAKSSYYVHRSMLARLCLVNSRFNEYFTPILYYKFDFDDYHTRLESLWFFLRTVVERPDLAGHVRESHMSCEMASGRLAKKRVYDKLALSLHGLYKKNRAYFQKAAR